MPRNVARAVLRPPWHYSNAFIVRPRTYTSEAQSRPAQRTHSDNLRILRHADQKALIESKIRLNALIAQVERIRTHISALPTTVQRNPDIPPYINGSLRLKIRETPVLAETLIKRAENVKENLTDLQYAGYEDEGGEGGRQAAAMRALETEIQGWSKQEKEDKLRNWQYEEEARRGRLNDSSRRLLEFVQEMQRANQAPRTEGVVDAKAAAVTTTNTITITTEKADSAREKDKKVESKKKSKPIAEMGLTELQEQLKLAVNAEGGKK